MPYSAATVRSTSLKHAGYIQPVVHMSERHFTLGKGWAQMYKPDRDEFPESGWGTSATASRRSWSLLGMYGLGTLKGVTGHNHLSLISSSPWRCKGHSKGKEI